MEADSLAFICVVALEEEVGLFRGGENSDSGKSVSEVSDGELALVVVVEDSESVVQVEVWLKGQSNLRRFNFSLEGNNVADAVDKLVLFVKVKNGTLDRAAPDGA